METMNKTTTQVEIIQVEILQVLNSIHQRVLLFILEKLAAEPENVSLKALDMAMLKKKINGNLELMFNQLIVMVIL